MKYVLIILLISLCNSTFSQTVPKDSAASCIARWKKGETKSLHILHNKETYQEGKLKSQTRFPYEAIISVIDSTATGYTLQWVFHLPESIKKANPRLADSLPVFEGMKMLYKTSETGEFIELINWQEVKDTYVKMMEFSLPKALDSTGRAAVEQSKQLFSSREMVEGALIKEIQLFHLPYGHTFNTTEVKAITQLPNPFADEALPAVQSEKITELEPQQDYFKLITRTDIDKASAQKLFKGIFTKLNIADDEATQEAMKLLSSFEMKDYSEYRIILSTGWVKRMIYNRTGKTDQMNQSDFFMIEMKD
jgi:hypothetical protein